MGGVVAKSLYEWLRKKEHIDMLERLLSHITIARPEKTDARLAGKTFVFTGSLSSMSRDEAGDMVRRLGGKVSGSVSRKTSYVVGGAKTGSKEQEARRLGVPVLTEQQFLRIVGE